MFYFPRLEIFLVIAANSGWDFLDFVFKICCEVLSILWNPIVYKEHNFLFNSCFHEFSTHLCYKSHKLIHTAEVDALLLDCDGPLLLLDLTFSSRFCCCEVEPPVPLAERLGSFRGILYLWLIYPLLFLCMIRSRNLQTMLLHQFVVRI